MELYGETTRSADVYGAPTSFLAAGLAGGIFQMSTLEMGREQRTECCALSSREARTSLEQQRNSACMDGETSLFIGNFQ